MTGKKNYLQNFKHSSFFWWGFYVGIFSKILEFCFPNTYLHLQIILNK